jgi:hypothetical protein
MSNTFDGLVGKTVARIEYVTFPTGDEMVMDTEQETLTLHFTDGSMLVVCERMGRFCDPVEDCNGLEICASINEGSEV